MCKKSNIIGVKKVSISSMSCLTSPNNNTDSEWWFLKRYALPRIGWVKISFSLCQCHVQEWAISPVTGNSSLRKGPFPQNLSEYH